MKIIGVDFTSAPRKSKPITVCVAERSQGILRVSSLTELTSFQAFDVLLQQQGPWIAGMDFPFAQSRILLKGLGWPLDWPDYVRRFAALSRNDFVALLEQYKSNRPAGDREHRRKTDMLARSISPQKLYGVPVAKMFYEGATRLLRSGVNIPLLRPNDDPRVVIEAYPALVARRFVGSRSYKNDRPAKQSAQQRGAREAILNGVLTMKPHEDFELSVELPKRLHERLLDDPTADSLDALLCTLPAAWAWGHRGQGFGFPQDADPTEGWIVDPSLHRPVEPTHNLFHDLPCALPDEVTTLLASAPGVRIERILSRGQVSPEGFWYDQDEHEYVILLQGEAGLRIEGEVSDRHLRPGDALLLPAHCRHRVTYTPMDEDTVWLAVFYSA